MPRRNPDGHPTRVLKRKPEETGLGSPRTTWTVTLLAALCLAIVPRNSAAEGTQPAEAKGKAGADLHGDPLPAGALARLGTTRLRHDADVTYVSFAANGKTLITAGEDNTIRLWDLSSGKEIRRFVRGKPAAAPKPQKKAVKVAPDKQVEIELEAVFEIMMDGGNDRGSLRVALAPDGKTLAAGSGGLIHLFEVATGKELLQIQTPIQRLSSLLFSPDGRTLAGRSGNSTLFLWAVDTGKEMHRIGPPQRKQGDGVVFILGGIPDAPPMTFTPDGKALAAASRGNNQEEGPTTVKFWDVASGKESRQVKAPIGVTVSALAFGANGKVLAYAAGEVVHLCEADTGKEVRQFKAPGGAVGLVFSPNSKTLAGLGRNQRVRLWETETGKELHHFGDASEQAQTGGFIFVSNQAGPETRAVAFSPDGKQLASAAGSTVRLWDTATGKEIPLLDGHWKSPSSITLSADGKTVLTWGADRVIRRWQAADGKLLQSISAPKGTTVAAFSLDGKTVALANNDNTIRLHETDTGKELNRIKGQPNGAAALVFAPDGKMLAARGGDNRIRLYDVVKGSEVRQITLRSGNNPAQGNVIFLGGSRRGQGSGPGLVFSPDGKLLVTTGPSARGGDNPRASLVFIDVATGKEIRKIETPPGITSCAFSPDGRVLATQNADRTITLWEVASGKQRVQLGTAVAEKQQGNGGMGLMIVIDGLDYGAGMESVGPIGLAFSPDGRALAARGPDWAVLVWDVTAGKEIGQLKGHEGRIETVAFAPDGKTLASGARDTTILLWDAAKVMKDLSGPKRTELQGNAAEGLWSDLAGEDAAKAFRSMLKLANASKQGAALLSERLKPAATVDPKKIAGWIADLENDKFAVRQEGAANLLKVGEQAVPALQKVLGSQPELETRKRVEELLDTLTGGTLTADQLRMVRAVEALERMGTPEARQVLRKLAQGAPGALPTREAQAALDRLH